MQFSDAMVTEGDSMMDNFIIIILIAVYQIKMKPTKLEPTNM